MRAWRWSRRFAGGGATNLIPAPAPISAPIPAPAPALDTRLPTRLTPLALWALAPFLLTVATVSWLHLLLDRCLLFTVPALILLTTIGIHRFTARPRVVRRVATALVAVIAAFAPFDWSAVTRNTLPREPDYHSVALEVLADQRPGDGIAYTHRLKPRRALDFELREGPRPRDALLHDTPQQRADYEAGESPDPRIRWAGAQLMTTPLQPYRARPRGGH